MSSRTGQGAIDSPSSTPCEPWVPAIETRVSAALCGPGLMFGSSRGLLAAFAASACLLGGPRRFISRLKVQSTWRSRQALHGWTSSHYNEGIVSFEAQEGQRKPTYLDLALTAQIAGPSQSRLLGVRGRGPDWRRAACKVRRDLPRHGILRCHGTGDRSRAGALHGGLEGLEAMMGGGGGGGGSDGCCLYVDGGEGGRVFGVQGRLFVGGLWCLRQRWRVLV